MTLARPEPPAGFDPHALGAWLSPGGILAAFLGFLGYIPAIIGSFAALAAAVFYITQTLQSPDIQLWLRERRERKRQRRIAELQIQQSIIVNQLNSLGALTHAEVHITDKQQTTKTEVSSDGAAH